MQVKLFGVVHLQVFFILNFAVNKVFNLRMEMLQPPLLLGVIEVYAHVSTGGHDVEFGIKHINPMNNTVEARKSESCVTLVLTNSVLVEILRILMLKVYEKSISQKNYQIKYRKGRSSTFQQFLGKYW